MKTVAAVTVLALLASAASAATGPTRLRMTVWPEGRTEAQVHRYTLSCAPAEGTVPRPARACRVLHRLGRSAFAPVPPTTVCTDLYGGSAQARVRGLVVGRRIDVLLRLSNGCEIARWNRVAGVVPKN